MPATQFPDKYRGGAFVAFHGSWNRAPLPQQGYNVVFVPFDGQLPSGNYESFAEGFKGAETLLTPNSATYRPTGLAVGPDGSLYVAEDQVGRIWKIMYTGGRGVFSNAIKRTESSASTTNATASNQTWDLDPQGQALYNQYCLACHQIDGSGVPNMQPSLIGSERLASHDEEFLIRLMLQGSEWIEDRQYNNLMASFAFLSDEEIAHALNYSKARFANAEPSITAQDVGQLRDRYAGSN